MAGDKFETRFGTDFEVAQRGDGMFFIRLRNGGGKLAKRLQGTYTSAAEANWALTIYAAETKNVKSKE